MEKLTGNLEWILIEGSLLLLLSVLASRASSRLGIPALVLFLLLGMLTGSEGIGNISFDNAELARSIGTIALAFILFAGGLDSSWHSIRSVLAPGIILSSLGVVITAIVMGFMVKALLGESFLWGVLLGSIVSCTDAAAVFGVMRARSLQLKGRLTSLLELESGANDPMAVGLTVGLTALALDPTRNFTVLLPALVLQLFIGGFFGWASGAITAAVINRARLDYEGLYPALTTGACLFIYAGAQLIGGSGFLAVYVAGVMMGSRNFVYKISLTNFHSGLAWLMQIVMFITLGLLVFPSHLLPVAGNALILALFLIFVARPAATLLSLVFFPHIHWSKKFFISWVGLRGAAPIVLATIPLTEGVARADEMFNIVFFIVLTSVLLQGTTIRFVARYLGVLLEDKDSMAEKRASPHIIEVTIKDNAPVVGRRVVDLNIPRTALIVLLTRRGESYVPRGATQIENGDRLLIATRRNDTEDLCRLFEA